VSGAALLAALAALTAIVAAPVAQIELTVSKPTLVLHEQVVVSLRITHAADARPRWEAPSFEGFWTERLPAVGGPTTRAEDGSTLNTTTLRRALFPSRTGALVIARSRVLADGPHGKELAYAVEGAQVEVVDPPAEGRPETYTGVVGELTLQLSLDRDEVALGRSMPLTLNLFGEVNVWDARVPELDTVLPDTVEVFASRPRLVKTEHRGTLRARRIYEVELVPQKTGVYTIPRIEIPYFDPVAKRYRTASSEPVSFRAVPAGRATIRRPWENPAARVEPSDPYTLALRGVGLLLALAASAIGLAWWSRRSNALVRRPSRPRPQVLLERARAAEGQPDFPQLLRAALLARVHIRHGFDPRALTTAELASRIDDPKALDLLHSLDALRFRPAYGNAESLLTDVADYVART
jgi:hypothetical protein